MANAPYEYGDVTTAADTRQEKAAHGCPKAGK
jgi:hypothetical protein